MPYSVFVSYVYDDARELAEKLVQWGREGRLGTNVVATLERLDYRPEGQGAVRRELNALMNGAAMMMAVVGNNSHDRPWPQHEVNFMLSARKPVIVVRMPQTTGAPPRELRSLPEVTLEPNAIARSIRDALGLG